MGENDNRGSGLSPSYWVARFLDDLAVVRSVNTVRAYREDLARWVAFCVDGGVDPLGASPSDVVGFVRAERERTTRGGGKVGARTVVRRLAAIRQWYEFLCLEPELSGVRRNPVPGGSSLRAAVGVATRQPALLRYDHTQPETLSTEEIKYFVESLVTTRYRDKALALFLVDGALRIHEALGLRMGDIEWAGRRVTVRAAKTRATRAVPLTARALAAVSAYLRLERPRDLVHDRVFVCLGRRSFGQPFNYRAWVYVCEQARKKAGTPRVHAHAFRHTQATNLAEGGMPLDSLRIFLGHRHLNTTLIYDRIRNGRLRREYDEAMGERPDDRDVETRQDTNGRVSSPSGELQ